MAHDVSKLVNLGQIKAFATRLNTLFSSKVDKVTTAAQDNLTAFGSGGAVADSGIAKSTVATKVTGATANNLAALNSSGNLIDAGIAKANVLQTTNVATDAEVTEALTEVLGS